MKPLIIISAVRNLKNSNEKFMLHESYVNAVRAAGGTPILAPITNDLDEVKSYISMCEGLVLPGGEDVSPMLLNEEPIRGIGYISAERDRFEFMLLEEARRQGKPILGICKGCQIIGLSTGGKIYQDIFTQHPNTIEHSQPEEQLGELFHSISLTPDSKLYELFKSEQILANSWHHQAVRCVGAELKITAKSSDGIIEGIESIDGLMMGVQWHPELLFKKYPEQLLIYKQLIEKCIRNRG